MPLTSAQMAALVERARTKPPPVVSLPPPASPTTPAPTAKSLPHAATAPAASPPTQPPAPPPAYTAEATDFPIGWELKKNSWHFHRRFYAVFRRPMELGEYSHLLGQVRRGTAEHLGEYCRGVTLPGGSRTLPVRATPWRLITILPKNWQPPTSVAPSSSGSSRATTGP